jgi:hypothetical protein
MCHDVETRDTETHWGLGKLGKQAVKMLWIEVARDRCQWQAFVNNVNNLWVLRSTNFLTS